MLVVVIDTYKRASDPLFTPCTSAEHQKVPGVGTCICILVHMGNTVCRTTEKVAVGT